MRTCALTGPRRLEWEGNPGMLKKLSATSTALTVIRKSHLKYTAALLINRVPPRTLACWFLAEKAPLVHMSGTPHRLSARDCLELQSTCLGDHSLWQVCSMLEPDLAGEAQVLQALIP